MNCLLESTSDFDIRRLGTDLNLLQGTWEEDKVKYIIEEFAIRFWRKQFILKSAVFGIFWKVQEGWNFMSDRVYTLFTRLK